MSGYNIFIIMKKTVQIIPLIKTVIETPQICAKLPASKFPKGINPANVNINALIALPLNSSGTNVCNKVFTMPMAVTEAPPINIKIISEMKYVLDRENSTREIENIMEDEINNLPLYLKSPKRANINAPIKAPKPAEDISEPRPFTPTFNTSFAKIGISIT